MREAVCRRLVICVLPYLGMGGTELHALHLLSAIRWEYQPTVVAPDGALRSAFEATGIRVLPFTDLTRRWVEGVRSYRKALMAALTQVSKVPEAPPIIHVHSGAELLWLARSWVPAARFVFSDHGYFGPGAGLSYRLASWILRRTRTPVITVSNRQKAIWVGRLGLAVDQVTVIPNGVPDPLRASDFARQQGGDRPPWLRNQEGMTVTIGAVGRLEPQKGFGYLLDAFEKLAPAFPRARLVLVGEGSLRSSFERRVSESPLLAGRVHLAGRVPGAALWMRFFDVYCQPSLDEGMPLSLIEAIASGCAVVATAVGGVPEVIEAGQSGLLVPAADAATLAAALGRLLADEELRTRLGRAARERYEKRFTHRAMALQTASLYERL